MTVETATFISDLNATYPASTDQKSEGDNHIRLLKSTIKATFPNVVGAVTPTAAELNKLTGLGALSGANTGDQDLSGKQNVLVSGANIKTVGGRSVIGAGDSPLTANNGAGVGYAAGSGGTVTQLTSKSTSVTLNKVCGQIVMNNAALASGATVTFTLNNSMIGEFDTLVVNPTFPIGLTILYAARAYVKAGAAYISITNHGGFEETDQLAINFAVIKGAIT